MLMAKKYLLIITAIVLLAVFFWPKPNGEWSTDAIANLADKSHYENSGCMCIGFDALKSDCKSCTEITDCYGIPILCNSYCRKKTNETWDYVSCESLTSNPTNVSSNFSYPIDNESCIAQGGIWGPIGLSPEPSCMLPTTDAGKVCSDSSECQAACVAELSQMESDLIRNHIPVMTTGKCTAWIGSVGCKAYVENGVVNGVLCVD